MSEYIIVFAHSVCDIIFKHRSLCEFRNGAVRCQVCYNPVELKKSSPLGLGLAWHNDRKLCIKQKPKPYYDVIFRHRVLCFNLNSQKQAKLVTLSSAFHSEFYSLTLLLAFRQQSALNRKQPFSLDA